MEIYKKVITEAIRRNKTIIAEHRYCDAIKDLLSIEVRPLKLEGDFLICYDIEAEQHYAINLKFVKNLSVSGIPR